MVFETCVHCDDSCMAERIYINRNYAVEIPPGFSFNIRPYFFQNYARIFFSRRTHLHNSSKITGVLRLLYEWILKI